MPVVQQANRDIRDLADIHARSENYGTELLDGCVDAELSSGRRHGEHDRVDEEGGVGDAERYRRSQGVRGDQRSQTHGCGCTVDVQHLVVPFRRSHHLTNGLTNW